MLLKSTAQELVIMDPYDQTHSLNHNDIIPLQVSMEPNEADNRELYISDDSPEQDNSNIVIEIEELPGAPAGTADPHEEPIEITDDSDVSEADENDAKKSKKNEKWDWESKGPHGFVAWIKTRVDDVPKHSGYDSAGLERAMSYMERLDNEISKAMRLDLDGELDANKIEEVRSQIDEGLSRLYDRLEKVKKTTKTRRKKRSDYVDTGLIKEGQKITGVQGVFVTVPLLISGIGRICINSMVSAGHDIEDVYAEQVKKWGLNDREKAEVRWFLYDLGYPMRGDRGYLPDEEVDPTSSNNFDWAANYKG